MINIYTDGATVGYNGKLGTIKEVGIGIYCPDTDLTISKKIKGGSNNEAEFLALLEGMNWCIKNNHKKVVFNMDSQIVCNRANGRRPKGKWQNDRMDNFQDQVLKLSKEFEFIMFRWIPRCQNYIADQLSQNAKKIN